MLLCDQPLPFAIKHFCVTVLLNSHPQLFWSLFSVWICTVTTSLRSSHTNIKNRFCLLLHGNKLSLPLWQTISPRSRFKKCSNSMFSSKILKKKYTEVFLCCRPALRPQLNRAETGGGRILPMPCKMWANMHIEGRGLWSQNCRRRRALNFTPPLINPPHFLSSVFSLPLLVAKLLPGCECVSVCVCVCVCVCVWNDLGQVHFSLREAAAVMSLPAKAKTVGCRAAANDFSLWAINYKCQNKFTH